MSFNSPKDFTIHGGAYNTVNGPQTIQNITQSSSNEDIVRLLATYAALNATSDAEARYPPPNCHPNTRVSTLQRLSQWIQDKSSTTKVFWVYGAAGVGKSAIAQKIAEDHRDRVLGAFFFSRNDSTRDKLQPFVATLAYQCCTSEPLRSVVGPLIIEAIRSNPMIFQSTSEAQFQKLLLEPFSNIPPRERIHLPNSIVVDGLDECIDIPSQERLLGIIDRAVFFTKPNSFPFIFLLCSRPEPQICHGIDSARFASVLECIEISATTVRFTGTLTESDLDIQRYLSEKFGELRKKYHSVLRYEGEEWPNRIDMLRLVERASGQFIFAATVIGYIDTPDERPQDRLQRILCTELRDIQESPYPALDILYRQILASCHNWDKVSPILRLLITPQPRMEDKLVFYGFPLNLQVIKELFQLEPGEVEMLLSKLHSVIHISQNGGEVRILHASFTEFLLDRARAGNLSILRYSTDENCQLFASYILRMYTLCAPLYPPYYSSQESFEAACVEWQEMVYEMFGWIGPRHLELATYCCQIQTPSDNYLAELDEFKPSCAVAVVWMKRGMMDLDVLMVEFRNWLQWAKSLRRATPQRFIKRMETFLDGFYIVYPIEHLRLQAIEQVFEMESSLRPFERDGVDRSNSQAFYPKQSHRFASSYFQQQWFKLGEDKDDKYTPIKEYEFRPPLQLILPTTSDLSMTLPDGYVPVHITKANAEMLAMVYRVYNSLENDARMVFNDDVIHDTSVSVRLGLVKEEDLAAFKKLLYERRDFLENPRSYPTPLPSTSLSQHGQSPRNEFNLCWYTCLAFVGLLVALVVPLAIGMAGYS